MLCQSPPLQSQRHEIYTCEGGLDKADITDILELAAAMRLSEAKLRGR